MLKRALALFIIVLLCLPLIACTSNPQDGGAVYADIVICEVMSSNSSTIADCDGEYSDYIVIYNRGSGRANLTGWCLSDNKTKPSKWELPSAYMEAGEYFVIFASGKDKVEAEEYHTNFALSSGGEELILVDPAGGIKQELVLPELGADIAYGLKDHNAGSQYCYYASGMPGKVNTSVSASSIAQLIGGGKKLAITEYMNNNSLGVKDNYGQYSDFVEITNLGEDCIISGLYLSDDASEPEKWLIPGNISLASGQSTVIWLSGRDQYKDGVLHASFSLSSKDKHIIISDSLGELCRAELEYLPANISKGTAKDQSAKWVYFDKPTPGAANPDGFETLEHACGITAKGIWVNEVSSVATKEGSYDWIELYNGSDEDISLEGYSITDNLDEVGYVFGDVTVKSGQYKLLYASGGTPEKPDSNSVYLPFKINNGGTDIYIIAPDGRAVDAFSSGMLDEGLTSGRSGISSERVFFDKPTPGAENGKGYKGYAAMPEVTKGGYALMGDTITASGLNGQTLRYTLDGSTPTAASPMMESITITKTTVLKVRAFQDGLLPSPTVTATYVVGKHDVPFISLTSDPDGLFGHNNGILANGPGYTSTFPHFGANFWQEWERRATFEFYTPQGEKTISLDAGVNVFGQYSRGYAQKSLAVHFRDSYGTSQVTYPFFTNNEHTNVKHLVLRAGGQDQNHTRIRDAFCAQVLKGHTDVALMDWAPVALYINGEYWGYYDLREKVNEDFLAEYYGLDPKNVTIIKGDSRALEGDNTQIKALYEYVRKHDLTVKEHYDYVCSQMDTDNFIDYLIAEIFFANGDTGNKKCFKENTEGSKWRWVVFDMDMTMRNESLWGDRYNTIEMLFNPDGHGSNNGFTTCLQRGLIKNSDFRKRFITRYAQWLNTIFMPENLNAVFDSMVAQIDTEMAVDATRWNRPTYEDWLMRQDELRNVLNKRRDVAKKQLIEFCNITQAEQAELFPNG